MIRSKISIMAVLGFGICSVACNKSAATETQSAATKSSAKSAGFALASALQSPDLNSRAYDIRLERALKNAMISRALASAEDDQKAIVEKFDKCFPPKTASPAETAALGKEEPPKNCKNGDGDEFGDGEATVDSKGIVQFCESGRAKAVEPSREVRDLVVASGATNEEIANTQFYFIKSSEPNAWANVADNGKGTVVLYEGLIRGWAKYGIYSMVDDGGIAGALVHELGHIKDFRANGFNNLKTRGEAVEKKCYDRLLKLKACNELAAAMESCVAEASANTRAFENKADANIAPTFARTNSHPKLNPWFAHKWFTQNGTPVSSSGANAPRDSQYDPTADHPKDLERAHYLEISLNAAKIKNDPSLVSNGFIKRLLGGQVPHEITTKEVVEAQTPQKPIGEVGVDVGAPAAGSVPENGGSTSEPSQNSGQ